MKHSVQTAETPIAAGVHHKCLASKTRVRLPCQARRTSITMLSGRTLAPGVASALDSAPTGQWPTAAPFWHASKPSGHTRGPCPRHASALECDANMRAGARRKCLLVPAPRRAAVLQEGHARREQSAHSECVGASPHCLEHQGGSAAPVIVSAASPLYLRSARHRLSCLMIMKH